MRALTWLPGIGVAVLTLLTTAYLLGFFAGVANHAWIFGGALAFPIVCALLGLAAASFLLLLVALAKALRTRANMISTASTAGLFGISVLVLILSTPSLAPLDDLPSRQDGSELRALAWNVHQEDVSADDLVDLMGRTDADVVVFAELYSGGDEARFPGGRYPEGYQLVDGHSIAVTLFVSEHLGEYRLVAADDDSGAYTGIVAEPVDSESTSPKIVAVHTTRMALNPDIGARPWQHGMGWISSIAPTPTRSPWATSTLVPPTSPTTGSANVDCTRWAPQPRPGRRRFPSHWERRSTTSSPPRTGRRPTHEPLTSPPREPTTARSSRS